MSVTTALAQTRQQAAAAFLRHAKRPGALGPADEHERLWLLGYEARAADHERNPAYALTLLPTTGDTLPLTGMGLPLLPVGVRYVVSDTQVTVTLEVGGPVTATVQAPDSSNDQPDNVPVTSTATRSTATFTAGTDGLYRLNLSAATFDLATLYIPVLRGEWAKFREQVRELAAPFVGRRPNLTEYAQARLARLIWADAAARCSDPVLFAQVVASLARVPVADSPVALYPHG